MGERYALIIGAIAYPGKELVNAVDDAIRVARALKARGFIVKTVTNLRKTEIDTELAAFRATAQTAELAIIFLAGHAVERHGSGYFLPVDFQFPLQPASLPYTAVSLNAFVEATEGAGSRIVVLDACRNWPQDPDEARRASNDLDQLVADERDWPNLMLAYATSAMTGAGDGAEGVGSAFSNSLCRHLLDHGLSIDECFRRVSQDVVAQRREQLPWTYSSLIQTLSFTDLPRFSAIQRHAVPNPQLLGTGAWTVTDAKRREVIVGVGDTMAWRVGVRGFGQAGHSGGDSLMGAADTGTLLLLAGSEGALYIAGDGPEPVLDLNIRYSHGLTASPTGKCIVYYGSDAASRLEIASREIKVAARYELGFEIYSCIYMPDGLIWVAGEHGRICEINPLNSDAPVREIARLGHHVNMMAVAPRGDRVFVVGQCGLAVELDRSGNEVADLLPGRRFKTAAGIRAQLLNVANDEHIHQFIFEPAKLCKRVHGELSEHLGIPDLPACALAPTLPILAIATEESSVVLLDTRDLQVIQELDVGSGNSSMVAGVHFLSDNELTVIGGRGEITFFGA
ncbi:MAG: caspase family protein [Gluconobacter potus]|uniref:caspase family protein n=1 Tax=Gluconobacter potus TaxID=2724927 RepID=UPI0039E73E30